MLNQGEANEGHHDTVAEQHPEDGTEAALICCDDASTSRVVNIGDGVNARRVVKNLGDKSLAESQVGHGLVDDGGADSEEDGAGEYTNKVAEASSHRDIGTRYGGLKSGQ